MLFKSEKKIVKQMVLDAIEETSTSLFDDVNALNEKKLDENAYELELGIIKKRHLDECLAVVEEKLYSVYPESSQNIQYLLMDPGSCGYELDTENGILAGGIYALSYYAVTGKVAAPADCAELNSRHAVLLNRIKR